MFDDKQHTRGAHDPGPDAGRAKRPRRGPSEHGRLPGCDGYPPRRRGTTEFAVYSLTDAARACLLDGLIRTPDPVRHFEDAVGYARAAAAAIPADLLRAITTWRFSSSASGMFIVRNLPSDPDLPPTPPDGRAAKGKETFIAEGRLLTLALLAGEVFGYEVERGGDKIHNTVPIRGKDDTPSSSGSRYLEAHTEVTAGRFERVAPEFLLLSFLRGDPQAATLYADARAIHDRLTPAQLAAARSVSYRTLVPASFTGSLGGGLAERVYSCLHPIFAGPAEDPEIIFDASSTDSATSEGKDVLQAIRSMLADPDVFKSAVGGQGDLFFLNNRRGLHGRTAFDPVYDGTQRWPQRVYVISPGSIHDNRAFFDAARRLFTAGLLAGAPILTAAPVAS